MPTQGLTCPSPLYYNAHTGTNMHHIPIPRDTQNHQHPCVSPRLYKNRSNETIKYPNAEPPSTGRHPCSISPFHYHPTSKVFFPLVKKKQARASLQRNRSQKCNYNIKTPDIIISQNSPTRQKKSQRKERRRSQEFQKQLNPSNHTLSDSPPSTLFVLTLPTTSGLALTAYTSSCVQKWLNCACSAGTHPNSGATRGETA